MTDSWASRAATLGWVLISGLTAPSLDPGAQLRAAAADTRPTIASLEVGFSGTYKVGQWTPVRITVRGASTPIPNVALQLTVPDCDAVPTRVEQIHNLAAETEQTWTLLTRFGRMRPQVEVALVADGATLARRRWEAIADGQLRPALSASDEVILSLGADQGVSEAARRAELQVGHRIQTVALPAAAPLPTVADAYAGVDQVVLSTSDALQFAADDRRWSALREWVATGGRLVLCASEDCETLLEPSGPLAPFLPGEFAGMVPLRRTTAIEDFCQSRSRITPDPRFQRLVPQIENVLGRVEVADEGGGESLPLVIRSPLGFGQVVFVGFALDGEPFRSWPGRTQLCQALLGYPTRQPNVVASEQLAAISTLGYDDLAGQLWGALEQYQGARALPFWIVAVSLLVYLAWIGPFDWLLVHRWVRRPPLTWVTFTTTVAIASLLFVLTARHLKGRQLLANQIELLDVDLASGQSRGTVWTSVFAPRPLALNVSVAPTCPAGPAAPSAEVRTSWLGLPGNALGGMAARSGDGSLFSEPYDYLRSGRGLRGVPFHACSSRGFYARWRGPVTASLSSELAETPQETLAGTLVHHLGQPLLDARLLFGGWAYRIGTLASGTPLTIDASLQPITAKASLVRRSSLGDKQLVTHYDRSATDVPPLVEMFMFHGAAGGRDYTGLTHAYWSDIDLSAHLQLGRATLTARLEDVPDPLRVEGCPIEKQRWTFVRFLLPVEPFRFSR